MHWVVLVGSALLVLVTSCLFVHLYALLRVRTPWWWTFFLWFVFVGLLGFTSAAFLADRPFSLVAYGAIVTVIVIITIFTRSPTYGTFVLVPTAVGLGFTLMSAKLSWPTVPTLTTWYASAAIVFAVGLYTFAVWGLRWRYDSSAARSWNTGRILWASAGLAIFVLTSLFVQDFVLVTRLRAEADTCKQMQVQLTPEPLPAADNGAIEYQQTIPLLEGMAEWPDAAEGDFDSLSSKGAAQLQQLLTLLRKAATKPSCRFDNDYIKTGLWHMQEDLTPDLIARQGVHLLVEHAAHLAQVGEVEQAIDDIASAKKVASHLVMDSRNTSMGVVSGIERRCTAAIEELVGVGMTDDRVEALIDETAYDADAIARHWKLLEAADRLLIAEGHLGTASEEVDEIESPTGILAPCIRFAMRLRSARDDLTAVQRRVEWLENSPDHEEDDELFDELKPIGVIARISLSWDMNRSLIGRSIRRDRTMANLVCAAELYHKTHGNFSTDMEETVRDVLTLPVDADLELELHEVADGLMIRSGDLSRYEGYDHLLQFPVNKADISLAESYESSGVVRLLGRARRLLNGRQDSYRIYDNEDELRDQIDALRVSGVTALAVDDRQIDDVLDRPGEIEQLTRVIEKIESQLPGSNKSSNPHALAQLQCFASVDDRAPTLAVLGGFHVHNRDGLIVRWLCSQDLKRFSDELQSVQRNEVRAIYQAWVSEDRSNQGGNGFENEDFDDLKESDASLVEKQPSFDEFWSSFDAARKLLISTAKTDQSILFVSKKQRN